MNWLVRGSEIIAGGALLASTVVMIVLLRPPAGQLQERLIVRFPGAWIIVGLPLTAMIATGVALIMIGTGILG
jgi:hypothetical protein